MPDQMEILLQEIAILRQEMARLNGLLEESSESLRSLNLAFLQRMEALTVSMQEILARLPTLPQ
jgi:hypothetical protein